MTKRPFFKAVALCFFSCSSAISFAEEQRVYIKPLTEAELNYLIEFGELESKTLELLIYHAEKDLGTGLEQSDKKVEPKSTTIKDEVRPNQHDHDILSDER